MSDIVERCTTTYTNDVISAVKSDYIAGDPLLLLFTPGPYFLDCNKIKLLFKLAYSGTNAAARGVSVVDPCDLFSLEDLTLNGTKINDTQENEGRGRYINFVKTLRNKTRDVPSAVQNNSVSIAAADRSFKSFGAPLAFVDTYDTYNIIATTALSSPSDGPFFRQ